MRGPRPTAVDNAGLARILKIDNQDEVIDGMNLAAFDLRLLLVFDALIQERSVTRASHRLGITQPAASNALNRLRHHLRDPLFLKTANGMEPTQRALDLAAPVAQALRQLEVVLTPAAFPPGKSKWTFQMAVSDHVSIVVLPHLAERVQTSAPGLDLRLKSKTLRTLPAMLDSGEVDIALGYNPNLPRRFKTQPLFEDRYVCLMRADHPLATGPLSLKRFAAARHVLVRPSGDSGSLLDELLARRKINRRISMSVTQLISAFFLVESSDLITAVFRSTADYCIRRAGLRLVARPLPLDPVQITMVWHAGTSDLPAHRWMRQQLADICRGL
jgi:DNA-binding transcriptional LysR family regulator